MNDTPRTDAARGFHDMDTAVSAENMAQLETELAAAKLDAEDQAKWALCYLARAEKAEAELATEREKVRVLRYVLSQIFEAMPTKRDWLDPVLEKVALAASMEASK